MSLSCAAVTSLSSARFFRRTSSAPSLIRILFSCDVVLDVFLALLALDLVKGRLRDVNFAGAHQLGHLPIEKCQQQRANVRAVHVRVRHDDDAAVAQFGNIEARFVFRARRPIFFRFADAGADGGDHRLDFVVLQKLIDARFLDVDQLAANRQDRLVTAVATLFGRAAGGITLDNIKLGQFRIALRTIRQLARQSAAGERAFANGLARFARRFPRPRRRQHFIENAPARRRVLIEVSHQPVVNNRAHDAVDLGVDQLHFGLRFESRIRQFNAQHADQTFPNVVAGNGRILVLSQVIRLARID